MLPNHVAFYLAPRHTKAYKNIHDPHHPTDLWYALSSGCVDTLYDQSQEILAQVMVHIQRPICRCLVLHRSHIRGDVCYHLSGGSSIGMGVYRNPRMGCALLGRLSPSQTPAADNHSKTQRLKFTAIHLRLKPWDGSLN